MTTTGITELTQMQAASIAAVDHVEIARLRAENAELVAALHSLLDNGVAGWSDKQIMESRYRRDAARKLLAKHEGK